ncbi:hypothetical protein [Polyangium jinanense]|uniref:DUF2330 domain-containing protein n=1 Tax=Polyangium jinanense TaxID=2829994 RepID=A0A9X3X838_9BACT|nr:hypothetical protein [Polyangium jinanense]MDC3959134.1 hypothetical protein [Polyangium jinanense]MDC3983943.1 hypothetical protein [Polyangium jinanense]
MKTLAPLVALSIVAVASPASAVAVGGATPSPVVHEDYVIVSHDEASGREHVLFAARLAPAAPRVLLGLPTPSTPTIEPRPLLDPAALVHALVEPYERRTRGRAPAPPAAWVMDRSTLSGFVVGPSAGEQPFDAAWTKSYVDRNFSFAVLDVVTPPGSSLEIMTPAAHVSFDTPRVILARREPPRAEPPPDEAQEGAVLPLVVESVRAEPKAVAPSSEVIARILRARSGPILDCYERFLEHRPEATKVTIEASIRPKGDTASLRSPGERDGDETTRELARCVVTILRARQFPRTDEGWKFSADLAFKPPRTPARRTHVVLVGPSRYVWKDPPASARLLHDFEARPEDVARAMTPDLRRALGLPEGKRLWISHWLDRDVRRALAEDALFDREALPADGEPGTLSAPTQKPPEIRPTAETAREKPRARSRGKRTRGVLVAATALLFTVALALWLARDERPSA